MTVRQLSQTLASLKEELHQQPSIRFIFHNRESLDGFINELKSIKLRY